MCWVVCGLRRYFYNGVIIFSFMAGVFDTFVADDVQFLRDLSDDLEGCLLSIAYAGVSEDIERIKGLQREIESEYAERLGPLSELRSFYFMAESSLGTAVEYIVEAYMGLQELLLYCGVDDGDAPEVVARRLEDEAQNLLYEFLIFPEDYHLHQEDGA